MSRTSCTGNVHLIVTCTRRKTVAAGGTVFPEECNAGIAYEKWRERLAQASYENSPMTAGDLYTGQHWSRAAAAAARTGTELWVISAGLGFLHVNDRVVPYDATYATMPVCHQDMWSKLTSSPPTERRCASLHELMQKRPLDRFVIAASPVYLRAVEADLSAGRGELLSPELLTIVTSKGYQGHLRDNVRYTSAGMMKMLNTNMAGLNISYALPIIEKSRLRRSAIINE